MDKQFVYKYGLIGLLVVGLMVPLAMIQDLVWERSRYQDQARQSIAQSWTGAQQLLGPVLVVPYKQVVSKQVWDEKLSAYRTEAKERPGRLHILPERLEIKGQADTEQRSRGLYNVPVYQADLALDGTFANGPLLELLENAKHPVELERPYVSVLLSDIRGVVTQPRLQWGAEQQTFSAGSGFDKATTGMHAPLTTLETQALVTYPFRFELALRGMERIAFAPMGEESRVDLDLAWPHPSFTGRYLPTSHEIDGQGFRATWQVSAFSSNIERDVASCAAGTCEALLGNVFGVSLVDPVDIYHQTERAVKYGLLFVVLTFVAFFLFEVGRRLRLHPMHYLLVGMALTLFYLLLLSLSEHFPFTAAYWGASLAATGLIGLYAGSVMGHWRRGLGITSMLLGLYGLLFAILRSEDNALLMGSILLFAVLALVMLTTRRLDWFAISEQMGRQQVGRQTEGTAVSG